MGDAMRRFFVFACIAAALVCTGCNHGSSGSTAKQQSAGGAPNVTPVKVRKVKRVTLEVKVSAPGRTQALEQQKVRAPFDCRLVKLSVSKGDFVHSGQQIGAVVSRNSEAALMGARAMLRDAQTSSARSDAKRAVKLAKKNLVRRPLNAPESGVVVSHKASEGENLGRGALIVSIAALDSFVFIARVTQTDLSRVKPKEQATVTLAAIPHPMLGTVHSLLPAASFHALTTPVRIDLRHASRLTTIGMFGTAQIVVGRHANVYAVPEAAILRNDITGVSRIALVSNGKAHWKTVTPGISQNGLVEIKSPPLKVGQEVIVSGQVGLPDNASVKATIGSATSGSSPTTGHSSNSSGSHSPGKGSAAASGNRESSASQPAGQSAAQSDGSAGSSRSADPSTGAASPPDSGATR